MVFFLYPVSFLQVLKPFHEYVFFVETSFARSNPSSPGHLIELLINFLILNLPFLLFDIVPFGAPLSRIKFVKLLVSSPVKPTILFFLSHSSKVFKAL